MAKNHPPTRGRRKARVLRRTARTQNSTQSEDVSKLLEKVNDLEKQLALMAGAVRPAEDPKPSESE